MTVFDFLTCYMENFSMNRSILSLAFAGMVGIAALALAQNADSDNPTAPPVAATDQVAVIDLVRIFAECDEIKSLNARLNQEGTETKQEAEQRQARIEQKQKELTAFEPGTSDYETRRKELLRLNIEANVWLKYKQEDIERRKFEWTELLYNKAQSVVAGLAAERGYITVVQRIDFKPSEVAPNVQALHRLIQERSVFWHAPEADITDEVIRRMDVAYKTSGGGKAPAASSKP